MDIEPRRFDGVRKRGPMTADLPKILLIDDDPPAANEIRTSLAVAGRDSFDVEWVRQLSRGLARLEKQGIDVVLLGLSLPDSQGMETVKKVSTAAPDVPIVILGGNVPEGIVKQAVGHGAQDYLLPGHLDSHSLSRALRHAIERKAIEDALHLERERAVVTLNSIGDAVLCTDMFGNITYLNLVAETLTGWPRQEAIGRPLAEVFRIIDGASRQTARDPMELAIEKNQTVGLTINCILVRRDGYESTIEDSAAPIHDRAGRVIGAVIVFHDVSEARAIAREMAHSAQHDLVTNLPNRLLLNDRITQAISLARRNHRPIAVIFLDLDHFKYINDSLGHPIGDMLLQSVSKRLLASVRSSDTISRLGGDEFVILLSEIAFPQDAATSAAKILLSLNAPHSIGGQSLHIDGSMGISIYPGNGEDAETLIKNADMAMYEAKAKGRNNFRFFTTEMNLKAVTRQSLEGALRFAVERNQFLLHYQPKVNLDSGDITGFEALIRWEHPERGLMPPSQFVPVAEDCGLILQVGRWVLREACEQARAWQTAGLPALPVAVNVSAVEFRHRGFLEGLKTILSETNLEARYLEVELTEGVLMEDIESTVSLLQELKKMGVHLAVDDFGTGFSSLSYLRRFPIDTLKIDQSFVQKITANPKDSPIVNAIIDLGKNLNHRVIAEGIETQQQREGLRSLGCTEGQGYLFSPPVKAVQFGQLLRRGIKEGAPRGLVSVAS